MQNISSTGVFRKALRGGSYRFIQKVFTFIMTSLILRKLTLNVTGAVTVQLELLLASIFIARDAFRLVFLRAFNLDGQIIISNDYIQQLINVAWLSTFISWTIATMISLTTTLWLPEYNHKSHDMKDYQVVIYMYCIAASIEAIAEPLYLVANCCILVSWQVSAQSLGFIARAIAQYICIFVFDFGLLSYGIAEIVYAIIVLVVFIYFFWRRIYRNKVFGLTSILQFIPRRPATIKESIWFEPKSMTLLYSFLIQGGVKYLLTEGDKWILSTFASLESMGIYGIVFHVGSLVPRILFLPIEEATKVIFSKVSFQDNGRINDSITSQRTIFILLRLMNIIGLIFLCFGVTYSHTLTVLLYGKNKAEMGVSNALAWYCIYIPFLGLNGVCEAAVHAVSSETQLMRLNYIMVGIFALYCATAAFSLITLNLGTIGIIIANCINMSCRIAYCLTFMARMFSNSSKNRKYIAIDYWKQSLPQKAVLVAFAVSFIIASLSNTLLLQNDQFGSTKESNSLLYWYKHGLHIIIGGICFLSTLFILYQNEYKLFAKELRVLTGEKNEKMS